MSASAQREFQPISVFLTPGEVAARLRASRASVYALIERGELLARRVGLALQIDPASSKAFLGS